MEERQQAPVPKLNIEQFRDLASEGKWGEYDRLAIGVANDEAFLAWTQSGLSSQNPHDRDLALTLLENTSSPIFEERMEGLIERRDVEEDPHLKRKAAIALFRHGE